MEEAIAVLKSQGAIVVDPADIPSVLSENSARSLLDWNTCSGTNGARGKDDKCSTVFKYGMKRDFNLWLASLGPSAPVKTLTELREFNTANAKANTLKYAQAQLDISDEVDLERDQARYRADREKDLLLTAANGIDAAMKQHKLDALLFPGASGSGISARPGYPTVIVPFAMIPNDKPETYPPGFRPAPSPMGVSFAAMACSEPKLLGIAYAFEQATRRRVAPPLFP